MSLILNPDLINIPLDDDNLNKIFNQKLNEEVKKYLEEEKNIERKVNNGKWKTNMNREKRYQITKERNESDMICEKIIDTKPIDKPNKNKFIKKTIKGIEIDVRSKSSLFITIGKWVIYIDNSTGEQIIESWID